MSRVSRAIAEWIQARTPGYDWGEHVGILAILAFAASVSLGLAYLLGEWQQLPMRVVPFAAFAGMILWPVYIISGHKHRQDSLLDRIRATFVISITHLMQERALHARNGLDRIRRMERRWRYGASYPYRLALLSSVILSNMMLALLYLFSTQHLSLQRHGSYTPFSENLRVISEAEYGPYIAIALAVLFAAQCSSGAFRITSRQWAEFYGDRLEAALRAGRSVDEAPQHEGPDLPPEGASASELLGLDPGFTKQELRKAWLRLARELHPDRWSTSGELVRQMKEAALKKVNAARDELAPLAR